VRSHLSARCRARCFTPFFVIALIVSIAFGGIATRADDPTATSDNTVGGLGASPPTPVPTATATVAPTATTAPTVAPAAATSTPVGTAAAPAGTTSGTPVASPTVGGNDTPTSGAPAASAASNDVDYQEIPNGGGSNNIVKVQNKNDNRLRVKAKIQLNHIPGDNVQSVNYAQAIGSCTDCQTYAVALQIDLRSRTATTVAPQNAAVALNVKCTRCMTVADAYQYVVPVDDPTQVPDNVKDLITQMQQQLNASAHEKDETAADAEAKINAVIMQFMGLGQSLYQQHDQTTENDTPDATVPPDATILTPTPTIAPQDTPTATP
jgi:hypothetical protein